MCCFSILLIFSLGWGSPEELAHLLEGENPEQVVAFVEYARQFNKEYSQRSGSSDKEQVVHRFRTYLSNLAVINRHNAAARTDPAIKFTMGVNQFTDLTGDEFARYTLGTRRSDSALLPSAPRSANSSKRNVWGGDAEIDWVAKGAVTPVKDQGKCGGEMLSNLF